MVESSEEKYNYRNSFKATLLFSGVQAYQIFIRILRSKFVAMFLGPEGMGIMSLLHSTTDLISATTNLGLKTSGVKSVAAANASNDKERIARIGEVLRKLIFLTGLLGMLICACFAPIWSSISFGNHDYTWSFVFISVIILLDQMNNGELTLLQGMQKKRFLATANIIGQTIGLLVAVPLYYFFRVRAIVWVLVLHSLCSFIISRRYSRKLDLPKINISRAETFTEGGEMIKLGFFLSLQYLFQVLSMYVVRTFVSNNGSLDDVGLYSAGSTIINMYVGLVFSAIATDYFPRLAGTTSNTTLCTSMRQQAEITILMLAPIIVAFIVFIKPVVVILYSERFLPIEDMLYWGMSAMLIKAMGWALSFSVLAKLTPKVFFVNELIAIFNSMALNICGYYFWGLTGFGISLLASNTIYLIQMIIVTRKNFNMHFGFKIWMLFILLSAFVISSLILKTIESEILGYVTGGLLLIVTSAYALYELNKRMDLISVIKSKRN